MLFGSAHGLRDEVVSVASAAGMAVCGAGCMGFVNNALGVRALGYLEPDPLPPGESAWSRTRDRPSRRCCAHAEGSAIDLRCRRVRSWSPTPPITSTTRSTIRETRLVALMMESPRAVPRLRGVLLRAAEADVPVVVLPVGGSPTGRAMVAAHSGALAGEDAAWARVLRVGRRGAGARPGGVRRHHRALLRGPTGAAWRDGIATVHDSGAERALTADLAHELGVRVRARCPTDTVRAIDELARRRTDRRPTRWTCGVPAPTPGRCSGRACGAMSDDPVGRGHRAGRRPGHRVRRRHRLRGGGARRRRRHDRTAGRADVGAVGDRPGRGGTAAQQGDSGARGHPQRPGRP